MLNLDCDADRCRLGIDEEMTIYTAGVLKEELLRAFARAAELELDLTGVSQIDSAGFQLLALLKREALKAGKKVTFCNHSTPVLQLLDTYNAVGLFGDPVVLSGDPA
jgi:anti-anti-sigma factor